MDSVPSPPSLFIQSRVSHPSSTDIDREGFDCSQHALKFARHLGVAAHDVLPALVRQPNGHAVDGERSRHQPGHANLVFLPSTTTLYVRRGSGVTSWSRSRSGRVIVGVGVWIEDGLMVL